MIGCFLSKCTLGNFFMKEPNIFWCRCLSFVQTIQPGKFHVNPNTGSSPTVSHLTLSMQKMNWTEWTFTYRTLDPQITTNFALFFHALGIKVWKMTTVLLLEMDPIHPNWCQEPYQVQVKYVDITDVSLLFKRQSIFYTKLLICQLVKQSFLRASLTIRIKLKILPSRQHWCSCLKELSGKGLALAATEVWWIIARGEKGEWGLTKSRRPKVSPAWGESCAPQGHKHTELKLKYPLDKQWVRKHTHVGSTHEHTWKYIQHTLRCGGDVKATGLLYKSILCSITATHTRAQTHTVSTHRKIYTHTPKKHECSMHTRQSRERLQVQGCQGLLKTESCIYFIHLCCLTGVQLHCISSHTCI